MASKQFYNNILLNLHFLQTHDIRSFLKTTKNFRRKSLSREFLRNQIETLQYEITKEDIKERYKEEFIDLDFLKIKWNVSGKGVQAKKRNFAEWYKSENTSQKVDWWFNGRVPKNLIYIFWGNNKKCLYIGRTGNGGSRPLSHFTKYWFAGAKQIEIIHTGNSKRLNKMECLAIHYHQPKYNLKKSARQQRSHICPICDNQKYLEKEMKKIFKPKK